MKLSTKLPPNLLCNLWRARTLTILLTALGLLFSTSPAWAQSCTVTATETGGGSFDFGGSCPTGYRDQWELFVDGAQIADGSGATASASGGPYAAGSHIVKLRCYKAGTYIDYKDCTHTFTVGGATPTPPGGVTPTPGPPGPDPDDSCNGGTGIKTGLGCIPTDPTGLVNKILQIAIGVSSGIALLLLISGAFKVLTSSGDPKAVMSGKETITSAIAGLLLILLSVAILNIIGIQILDIPIWGTP